MVRREHQSLKIAIPALAFVMALSFAEAFAAPPRTQGSAPEAGAGAGAVPPAGAPAAATEVNGFRSARFGMTEDEVRKAAAKDLSVKADAFKAEDHALERTRVLSVRVPDVLPKGGTAAVSYILGYTSKKLIQVNVLWSKATDPAMTPELMVANANLLGSYFQEQGFKPDSVVVNAPASGGIVVFRGLDQQGRMVAVSLLGTTQSKDGQQQFSPAALQLSYVSDPVKPDVFRVQPGQF